MINKHKVPQNQWDKWTKTRKFVFNSLLDHMLADKDMFLSDPAVRAAVPLKDWKVLAWNAAWQAGSFVGTCAILK